MSPALVDAADPGSTAERMVEVVVEPGGRRVRVPRGSILMEAMHRAGLEVETPCDGKGECYRCIVDAEGPLSDRSPVEEDATRRGSLAAGQRLACQTRALGDVKMRALESTLTGVPQIMEQGEGLASYAFEPNVRRVILRLDPPSFADQMGDRERVERALARLGIRARCAPAVLPRMAQRIRDLGFHVAAVVVGDEVIDVGPPEEADVCGVAFDIGTTTVVAYLMDLATGRERAVASALNPQSRYGLDVITRVTFAIEQADGLGILKGAVRDLMNDLIARVCAQAGVDRERVYEVSVVGNAVMQHLLLGIDPHYLAMAPYVPATTGSVTVGAASLGLGIHPEGKVYVLPGLGSFVGADTTGVILATRLHRGSGPALAIDIGTNGEIVGRNSVGGLVALSAAAGPAFEGGRITSGSRGLRGAIERVRLAGGKVVVATIGGAEPVGVCGSGLIDALAVMREMGVLAPSGRLLEAGNAHRPPGAGDIEERVVRGPDGLEFMLVEGDGRQRRLSITQKDIRELQLAKAAIAAGIKIVLREMGAREGDLQEVLLAGAFGTFIDKANARVVGLLPGVPLERVRSVGNAAGLGAKLALVSRAARVDAERVPGMVRVLNLTQQATFEGTFLESMSFS